MKTETNPMQRANTALEPASLQAAPRCGAKTRAGHACQSPAVKSRKRCRMHGGAAGSGAPKGKRNGHYATGLFTEEMLNERQTIREIVAETRELMRRIG
jgi:ribosomal protein L32